MRNLSDNFQNRTIQWNELLEYGFIQKEDSYYLERPIVDGLFQIVMEIGPATQTSKVIDLSTVCLSRCSIFFWKLRWKSKRRI